MSKLLCKYCGEDLDENNCYASDWKRGGYICKKCRSNSRKNNVSKEKEAIYSATKLLTLKSLVLNEYGNYCQCCGEYIWQFLTVDHVGNWGNKHRKDVIGARGGKAIFQWLKNNSFPKIGFRLLCYNCNCSIGFHGFCRHEIVESTKCHDCGILLNEDNQFNFYIFSKVSLCKNCVINRSCKRNTAQDKVIKYSSLLQRRIMSKKQTLNRRLDLINGYGALCSCCGETNPLFLTIDHILNNGAEEKKLFDNNMYAFYNNLKQDNYPKDNYRLLCYNCNCSRGAYGQCYHELCKKHDKESISIDEYKCIIKGVLNYV